MYSPHRKFATKGPSKRRSEKIIMVALEHLKTAGPTRSVELAGIIQCGRKMVAADAVLNFNTTLAEAGEPWRFRTTGGIAGHPVIWSVEATRRSRESKP